MSTLTCDSIRQSTHPDLDRPIFYVNLEQGFDQEDLVITGTITTALDLADHTAVLLVDDYLHPMLSVPAHVYYVDSSIEGNIYHYMYDRSHLGAVLLDS